jgi:transposase-like protein
MSRKGIPNKLNKFDTDIAPRLSEIKEWIENGDSIRDICRKLAISQDTWYRYQKEHETLSELVKLGRSVTQAAVEKSLLKLCTGYEFEELKTIVEEDRNGKKRTKLEKNKRHQPPSAQAISFFLRNRCPEEWSDKKELILDTTQNEQARKRLFLRMLAGEEDSPPDDEAPEEGVDDGE